MDNQQRIKDVEDEVLRTVGNLPHWKQAIAYRYLFNLGIRIHDIDRLIKEGLKDEKDKPKIGFV